MDRLRAIRYLAAAADGASLSAAARLHGVSVAAVAKLIEALESDMRVQLLARHANGVTPTVAGRTFLELSRPALVQLDDAVEQATASATRIQGTVVVGVQPVIAQEVLTAALPKFCALPRHPARCALRHEHGRSAGPQPRRGPGDGLAAAGG